MKLMELKHFPWVCLIVANVVGQGQDYSITPIKTSSGLYYENIGEVLLSNSNWQFVTSVDYKGYLLFYEYLFQQSNEIYLLCQTLNSLVCMDRYQKIQPILDGIEETDESMANFLGISSADKPKRVKRFWAAIASFFLNIGGAVVTSIFGHKDRNIAEYDRAINNLHSGQKELENQLLLQRTLFMIDSEKKDLKIDWLKKTQNDIQGNLSALEHSFQEDKVKKEEKINKLKEMLVETQERLKLQEENQKKLNSDVKEIEKNLIGVKKDIKEVKERVSNNTNKINKLEELGHIEIIFTNFILLMEKFKDEQNTLYDVITNANKGELVPYILTPSKLIEMLQNIQPKLKEGTEFPFYPNTDNARKLYNIIKPSVQLFNYKIIFILDIPLIYSKSYGLHKLTSLPIAARQNTFLFILPQEPFLIVDKNYNDYMLISKENFMDFCKNVQPKKYICNQVQEISHSYSTDECEVNLFKSPKQIPNTCRKRIMLLDKPMFLQLQQLNSWIYVIHETENVIVSCHNKRVTESLNGTGLIHLSEGCILRTHDYELTPLVKFTNPVESTFSPPLNITNGAEIDQYDEIEAKSPKHNIHIIYPFDFQRLEEISYDLRPTKTSLTALYWSLFFIILIVSIIIGYLLYKKKIDLGKFLIRKETGDNIQPSGSSSTEVDRDLASVKLKLKVENKEDVKGISIYGSPSETDPDSEYLTVRFKVAKDYSPSAPQNDVLNNQLNTNIGYTKPKVNKDEQYLNDLRKLKPKIKL